MIQQIIEQLQRDKKIVIRGFGTFKLVPRRNGKIYCGKEEWRNKQRFQYRLKFIISEVLKNKVCK